MTAQERKNKTEAVLFKHKIPINQHLPLIEEENEVDTRSAQDIAKRILILTYLNLAAETGEAIEIVDFLKNQQLWDYVSDNERKLFSGHKLTNQKRVNTSWQSECIYLMLWALGKIDVIDLPTEQCSISKLLRLLPRPFETTYDFINNASVRTIAEILDISDLIYRIHWAVREAKLKNEVMLWNINSSVTYEWHYAINWITFADENWDDVTTDT